MIARWTEDIHPIATERMRERVRAKHFAGEKPCYRCGVNDSTGDAHVCASCASPPRTNPIEQFSLFSS